jgi:hypothetical protein
MAMEAEKAFHPIDVSPFGANRKMLSPHELSGLFEQGRFERPGGGGLGHNRISRLQLYSSQSSSVYSAVPVQKVFRKKKFVRRPKLCRIWALGQAVSIPA